MVCLEAFIFNAQHSIDDYSWKLSLFDNQIKKASWSSGWVTFADGWPD
jgi:hypothetical protein